MCTLTHRIFFCSAPFRFDTSHNSFNWYFCLFVWKRAKKEQNFHWATKSECINRYIDEDHLRLCVCAVYVCMRSELPKRIVIIYCRSYFHISFFCFILNICLRIRRVEMRCSLVCFILLLFENFNLFCLLFLSFFLFCFVLFHLLFVCDTFATLMCK